MANVDFSKRYKDYSVFMPAVSEMYGRFLVTPPVKRDLPKNLKLDNLNFVNSKDGLIFIPTALYSAGQAAKTKNMATKTDAITNRDRSNTILLGDSGGFQIQTGAIKFKGDPTRERMLRWLEKNCDWSMILDFPTGGVDIGTIDAHMPRLENDLLTNPYSYKYKNKNNSFSSVEDFCKFLKLDTMDDGNIGYSACLLQTMINNDYFIKHRVPGATKFLNVIQGRNLSESNMWYEHVKDYDFEGWALASHHKENFVMAMTRFVDMYHDGLLQEKDWVHMLGVGKLANGCAYTTMQRAIRENINPNLTISYDVSSPFTTAAFGNIFLGYTLDKNKWTIQSNNINNEEHLPGRSLHHARLTDELRKIYDKKNLKDFEDGGNSKYVETEIAKILQMSDLCVLEDSSYASSWDLTSYIMLMHHNLQVHLTCVFDAQDMYDKGDVEHVPAGLLRFRELIPDIFNVCIKKGRKAAKDMIMKYSEDLNFLAGDGARAGVQILTEFDFPKKSILKDSVKKIKEFNSGKKENFVIVDESLW